MKKVMLRVQSEKGDVPDFLTVGHKTSSQQP